MLIHKIIYFLCSVLLLSCHQTLKPEVPEVAWTQFDSLPRKLSVQQFHNLQGVYSIIGTDDFGPLAVLKWSYTVQEQDTLHYMSILCENEAAYFICSGKRSGTNTLLKGYWRKPVNTETGTVRIHIPDETVGKNMAIQVNYGDDEETPDKTMTLTYLRPLNTKQDFEIIGHRGGGRMGDLLPASENSVALLRMASQLGATGVEIDIQLTKDSIPVLYHDDKINDRLTQKAGIRGSLNEYTFEELSAQIHLKNGERIPTLEQALKTIVFETPLRYVWLDAKDSASHHLLRKLQTEYIQKATSNGRTVEITIGIHDEANLNNFKKLPLYQSIPSLCELDTTEVKAINSKIWAPMWTEGLQKEQVQAMQASGKKVFVWTIDKAKDIREFMLEGGYDGIVSNYPSLVAFYYYTRE